MNKKSVTEALILLVPLIIIGLIAFYFWIAYGFTYPGRPIRDVFDAISYGLFFCLIVSFVLVLFGRRRWGLIACCIAIALVGVQFTIMEVIDPAIKKKRAAQFTAYQRESQIVSARDKINCGNGSWLVLHDETMTYIPSDPLVAPQLLVARYRPPGGDDSLRFGRYETYKEYVDRCRDDQGRGFRDLLRLLSE